MLGEIHQQFIKVVRDGRGKRLQGVAGDLLRPRLDRASAPCELGLADGFGSLDSVARDVIKAENVVDFTPDENYFEQISKRLGAGAAESLRAPSRTSPARAAASLR